MLRLTVVLALGLALGGGGCGDDDDSRRGGLAPRQLEQLFLRGMVAHHESAVGMAHVALERAEHPELRRLAARIVDEQDHEIEAMQRIHRRLFKRALRPDRRAYAKLDLSAVEAGMNHDGGARLRRATPFDRAFIDAMVRHHAGAIQMAKAVRARVDDADVAGVASEIIAEQLRQIAQMQRWRKAWYGSPAASGDGGRASGTRVPR